MKVMLLNGSPHEKGCTYTALEEVQRELKKCGVDSEILHVGHEDIHGCIGCGYCGRTALPWGRGAHGLRRSAHCGCCCGHCGSHCAGCSAGQAEPGGRCGRSAHCGGCGLRRCGHCSRRAGRAGGSTPWIWRASAQESFDKHGENGLGRNGGDGSVFLGRTERGGLRGAHKVGVELRLGIATAACALCGGIAFAAGAVVIVTAVVVASAGSALCGK